MFFSPLCLSLCVYRALSFLVLCPVNSGSLGLSRLPNLSDELRDSARFLLSFPFLLFSLETLPTGHLFPFSHGVLFCATWWPRKLLFHMYYHFVLVQGFGFRYTWIWFLGLVFTTSVTLYFIYHHFNGACFHNCQKEMITPTLQSYWGINEIMYVKYTWVADVYWAFMG